MGESITGEVVARLAAAFGAHVGPGRRVCVGRDTRRSGPELEETLVRGLAACGLEVARLGVVSTPGLYFLTRELGFDAGVMITASHNPPEYNGFKFCDSLGMAADQEAIARNYFQPPAAQAVRQGRVEECDGAREVFTRLERICPRPLRPLRLVVDCACGPNSLRLPAFLRSHGHQVFEINCEPDVEKCSRVVEPMPSTLGGTIQFLHDSHADAALCLDGDNDRLVFLDREGFLGFQQGNAAMCEVVLGESGSREVAGSVETGRYVEAAVNRAGGTLVRSVVGDLAVARMVWERKAALGVEECGHYIIPRLGYFSATVYPATLMLARRDINKIREDLAGLPEVFACERRLDCPEERKREVTGQVAEQMRELEGALTDSDGVRMDWEDGWLLVRPSGTSPYMKVNAEAFTQARLDSLVALGSRLVQEALG